MGTVYETHIAIGGVPAATARRIAESHAVRLRAHGTLPSELDWSLTILSGLARSARDGLAVWGGGGKGMGAEVAEALAPFFRELLAEQPDARILYADESDSDEADDREVARWTELACSGLEEDEKEAFVERTLKVACRINAKRNDEDGDEDGDGDGGTPLDVDGMPTSPTWSRSANCVHVLGHGSFFDHDDASRTARVARLRDAASRATQEHVRDCLSALADATASWKDAAWPSWCHRGSVVDVGALVDALRTLTFALVVYQPDADSVKIARVEGGDVTHHDLPLALVWSPALSRTLPANIAEPSTGSKAEHGASAVAMSPHRAALFDALATASRVGLKDQPAFQSLLALSPAERRALLLDAGAAGASVPAAIKGLVESIVYLTLEYSVVVERFVGEHGLSPALARAIDGSQAVTSLAARAPRKPDRYEKEKPAYRSLVLLRAAQSVGGPKDPWRRAVEDDLATARKEEQTAWREAIAAWEEQPLPYPPRAAWKRYEKILAALGQDGGAKRARTWLALAREHDRSFEGTRDARQAQLRFLEGLIVIAAREPNESVAVGRLLLERALAPNAGGGVTSPRVAYRAIDLLAAAGDSEVLRDLAARSASPRRVRAYAALRATNDAGAVAVPTAWDPAAYVAPRVADDGVVSAVGATPEPPPPELVIRLEQYEGAAKNLVEGAQSLADSYGHARTEPIHLLVSALERNSGVAAAFETAGLDRAAESRALDELPVTAEPGSAYLSESMLAVLARAQGQADAESAGKVDVGQLLDALSYELPRRAAAMLRAFAREPQAADLEPALEYERFAQEAKSIVERAQALADVHSHVETDTMHLFAAALEQNLALATAFEEAGRDPAEEAAAARAGWEGLPVRSGRGLAYFSRRMFHVLLSAQTMAGGAATVSVGHLLVALSRELTGPRAAIVRTFALPEL